MVSLIDPLVAVNEFANDPDGDHVVEDVMFNVVVVPLTDCTMLITSIFMFKVKLPETEFH
jgi:hypothetical protein